MIVRLPRLVPVTAERTSNAGPDHPMRVMTRRIAFEPGGWTAERSADVVALFDGLAADWHTRGAESRLPPVADALERGGPVPTGTWVELGSGTGLLSPWLAARCARLLAVDLSAEMLALAPPRAGHRVRADGAHLPIDDGRVDGLILVNAFLFPAEARRIVAPGGVVVWVNTSGEGTPIHLSADDALLALGDGWEGVTSEAGLGTWTVLRRSHP